MLYEQMFALTDPPAPAPEPTSPAGLSAAAVWAWSAREAAQADLLLVLGDVVATKTFLLDGCTTATEWLRRRVDVDESEARSLVAAATRLQAAPLVTAAVKAGDVSARRAEVLTRPLGIERLRETFAAQEAQLLADTAGKDCERTARHAREWAARWEPAVAATEEGRVSTVGSGRTGWAGRS